MKVQVTINQMDIKVCISSDKGNVKEVNQDATMVKVANTKNHGRIVLGVLCDGMGGLCCGEVASAKAISKFETWFVTELPRALSSENATERLDGISGNDVMSSVARGWQILVDDINTEIIEYGRTEGITLGTTLVAVLAMGDEYLIINVGDSRIYKIDDEEVTLMTHDQSVVQDMMDKGLMTQEEANNSPQKSVLLQCIGVSESVQPQFVRGKLDKDSSFVMCSDGFWRKLTTEELSGAAAPEVCTDEEAMKLGLDNLINLVKERGERDNISAILVNIGI